MNRFKHGWAGAALAVALGVAACTPAFNWREVQAGDDGYRAMMPGKPAHVQRRINLDGLEVEMSMRAVEVEGMSFAVGAIRLPMGALGVAGASAGAQAGAPAAKPDDALAASLRERALAAMRGQMVRNLRGTEQRADPVDVPVIDGAGQVRGRVEGWQVEARGPGPVAKGGGQAKPEAAGEPGGADAHRIEMLARFAGRGDRVWQAVVIGPTIDPEQAKIFVESLRAVE